MQKGTVSWEEAEYSAAITEYSITSIYPILKIILIDPTL